MLERIEAIMPHLTKLGPHGPRDGKRPETIQRDRLRKPLVRGPFRALMIRRSEVRASMIAGPSRSLDQAQPARARRGVRVRVRRRRRRTDLCPVARSASTRMKSSGSSRACRTVLGLGDTPDRYRRGRAGDDGESEPPQDPHLPNWRPCDRVSGKRGLLASRPGSRQTRRDSMQPNPPLERPGVRRSRRGGPIRRVREGRTP